MFYEDQEELKKEVADRVRAMRKVAKKIGASKKSIRAFLVRAGIHKPNGELTARYK